MQLKTSLEISVTEWRQEKRATEFEDRALEIS